MLEFRLGFDGVENFGSQFNDVIKLMKKGLLKTNHSGGITGGISNGNDLRIKVFIKPTSSVQKKQETFNLEN